MLAGGHITPDFSAKPQQGVLKGKRFSKHVVSEGQLVGVRQQGQRNSVFKHEKGPELTSTEDSRPTLDVSESKLGDKQFPVVSIGSTHSQDGNGEGARRLTSFELPQVRPSDIVRAARRSVQEISKQDTSKPPRRLTLDVLEQQYSAPKCESRLSWLLPSNFQRPENASANGKEEGIQSLPSVQLSSAESDGKEPKHEVTIAGLMDYVPPQEIANRILMQAIDHERKRIEEARLRAAESGATSTCPTSTQIINHRIQADEECTPEALQDASGISGRTDVIVPLSYLKKGMQLPPSEIPERFYKEKILALGVTTPGEVSVAPHWDAKSRQWKTTIFPTTKPSNREEAAILAEVAETLLKEAQSAISTPPVSNANGDIDAATTCDPMGFRPEVVAEINAWSVITHELVRQVYVHCEDRGTLLARARSRLLQILGSADVWMKCHAASQQFDQEKLRWMEQQMLEMQDYVNKQNDEMNEILERYTQQHRDMKAALEAATANYADLQALFYEHLRLIGATKDAPEEEKMFEMWSGFSSKGNDDDMQHTWKGCVKRVLENQRRKLWDFLLANIGRLKNHANLESLKQQFQVTGGALRAATRQGVQGNMPSPLPSRNRSSSLDSGASGIREVSNMLLGAKKAIIPPLFQGGLQPQQRATDVTIHVSECAIEFGEGEGVVRPVTVAEFNDVMKSLQGILNTVRRKSVSDENGSGIPPAPLSSKRWKSARSVFFPEDDSEITETGVGVPLHSTSGDSSHEGSGDGPPSSNSSKLRQRRRSVGGAAGDTLGVLDSIDVNEGATTKPLPSRQRRGSVSMAMDISRAQPTPQLQTGFFVVGADVLKRSNSKDDEGDGEDDSKQRNTADEDENATGKDDSGNGDGVVRRRTSTSHSHEHGHDHHKHRHHRKHKHKHGDDCSSCRSSSDSGGESDAGSHSNACNGECGDPDCTGECSEPLLPQCDGTCGGDKCDGTCALNTDAQVDGKKRRRHRRRRSGDSDDSEEWTDSSGESSDNNSEGSGGGRGSGYHRSSSKLKCPRTWRKFLDVRSSKYGQMNNRQRMRTIPKKQCHQLILQIFQQKMESDKDELQRSSKLSKLADFVVNYMMFKFGHKKLVQSRLNSLITTIIELEKDDKLIQVFGRFCGLLQPSLGPDTLQFCLMGVSFACGQFPTISTTAKDTTVYLDITRVLPALDNTCQSQQVNSAVAKARAIILATEGVFPDPSEPGLLDRATKQATQLVATTVPQARPGVGRNNVQRQAHYIDLPSYMQILIDVWQAAANDKLEQLRTMFKEVDENGDGTLQFDEFCILLQKIREEMSKNASDTTGSSGSDLAQQWVITHADAKRLYIDALGLSESGDMNENVFVKVVYPFLFNELQRMALENEQDGGADDEDDEGGDEEVDVVNELDEGKLDSDRAQHVNRNAIAPKDDDTNAAIHHNTSTGSMPRTKSMVPTKRIYTRHPSGAPNSGGFEAKPSPTRVNFDIPSVLTTSHTITQRYNGGKGSVSSVNSTSTVAARNSSKLARPTSFYVGKGS